MSFHGLLSNLVSTGGAESVHDEEILNVLRGNDDIAMGTSAIAEAVNMSGQGVKDRLRDLVDEDRVRSQQIGRSLVWDLHPGERELIVPPEMDRLVHAFDGVRDAFGVTRRVGMFALLAGFALIFAALTAAVTAAPESIAGVSNQLLVWGYILAGAGSIVWVIGGGVQLGTVITERLVYRELTGETYVKSADFDREVSEQRGQMSPRLLVGLFVLILVGRELVTMTVGLYTGLASDEAFSPLLALIIAFLILLTLIAAILGLD